MTRGGPIVSVDSMTLMCGIRKKGPLDKLKQAAYLFEQLEEDEATIIVSAVVVAEYLIGIPPEDRENTAAAIANDFQVEPFDHMDAILASKLWSIGKQQRKMRGPGVRVCLRADTLIVATAKNRGASMLYTDDKDCSKLVVEAGMVARRLPTQPRYLIKPQ